MRSDFYVYVYFRPDTGLPCYVGKGRGPRWIAHNKQRSPNPHLRNIINKYGEIPCVKTHQGLTEAQAFEIEIALIAAIGRGKKGPLVNLTDGGEGSSGYVPSDSSRAKMSESSRRQDRIATLLARNTSPENIARLARLAQDPKRRAKASEIANSPEHLARLIAYNRSPEARAAKSVLSKRPEVVDRLRALANSPENRARRSRLSSDPDHLKKLMEFNKSPEHRAQVAERNRSPEMRAASSARAKARNASPEFQAKAAEGLRRYLANRQKEEPT
jgi:hypothetical protein